jgi:hypothetical protein
MMQPDYYSVLARAIASITQDEAQLRRMIYELARLKLRRQLLLRIQHVGRAGMDRQVQEFETAIDQIELEIAQNTPLLSSNTATSGQIGDATGGPQSTDLILHQSASTAAALGANLDEVLTPVSYSPVRRIEPAELLPPISQFHEYGSPRPFRSSRPKSWFKIQLIAAAILGIGIYATIEKGPDVLGRIGWHIVYDPPHTVAKAAPKSEPVSLPAKAVNPPIPNTPIPTNYGVYAADAGKLVELTPLPIKVPDRRISISTLIATPSPSTVSDGHLQFLVFRRDLANSVPDQVTVRVVAQIVRALTFIGGKATVTRVSGAWAVRGTAYDMKIAPVEGNSEMVVIRPPSADFSFPAGRYALVLKAVAYDFTVPGPITDVAHCLERTDTVDVPIYSECPSP